MAEADPSDSPISGQALQFSGDNNVAAATRTLDRTITENKQDLVVGQTVSVLGCLQKVGGSATYNRYSLWVGEEMVNDTTRLGAADFVFDTGSSGISGFSTSGFSTANLDGNPADTLLVDNLRIAVVSTPGTLALAGLGLFGLAALRRRAA